MLRLDLVLVVLTGCMDSDPAPGPNWYVQWNKTQIQVGEETSAASLLEYSDSPSEPPMLARGTTWSSSDSSIVTLESQDSTVTIRGAAVGRATLLATFGDKTSKHVLEVIAP